MNCYADYIFSAISILLGVIGGVFAYKQWTHANRIRQSEFINQIIEKLRFDKCIADTMYMIEYDHNWYSKDFYDSGSEIEFNIDKLLSYLSYICYLYDLKNISKNGFKIFQYDIAFICSSQDVQTYLWNLYHYSKSQNTECAFQYLIDYGIKYKLIDEKGFYCKEPGKYPRHLNF